MTKPKTAVDVAVVAAPAEQHPFAIELPSGTVIDRLKLNSLPSDKMAPALAAIYMKENARVVVVDDVRKFFGLASLLGALDNDDANLDLILEHNKIELTDDDLKTIKAATEIKSRIKTAIEAARKAMIPPYQFATIPDGWSIETHINIGDKYVTRKNDSTYRLGHRTLRALWDVAAPFWVGNVRYPDSIYVQAGGGNHARFEQDRILIGCQQIRRHELEQVALALGFTFPEKTVTD